MSKTAAKPVRAHSTIREFVGRWIDDGWEFVGVGRTDGWWPVAAWGRDGWNLGDWPLIVVLFREGRECRYCSTRPGDTGSEPTCPANPGHEGLVGGHSYMDTFSRAVYTEGDVTVQVFATEEERSRATDETAFFYWRLNDEAWIRGVAPGEEPDHLRGPYGSRAVSVDRPLTDSQERALIALSELPDRYERGWHRAAEIRCSIVAGARLAASTWFALKRLGLVECHESSVTPLEVKITEAGHAMLAGMGD